MKPNEGSSIFNFPLLPNNNDPDLSEKACEIKFDDLFPRDDHLLDNNSILDKLTKKEEKDYSMIPFFPTPIVPQFVFSKGFN